MNRDVVEPDFAGEQITRDTRTCDLKIAEGEKPRTVGAVLDLLKADPAYAYFCSTFNAFAKYLKVPDVRGISLDQVSQQRHRFSVYLANHQYSASVTARHVSNLTTALKRAEDDGWIPDEKMSPAWRRLLEPAKSVHCDDVLRDFDRDDILPNEVTVDLITTWVDTQVIECEHTYVAALRRAGRFSRLLRRSDLLKQPNPNPRYADPYGIPLKRFPSPMKEETKTLTSSRVDGPDLIEDEDLAGTWEDDTRRRQGKEKKQPEQPIRSV